MKSCLQGCETIRFGLFLQLLAIKQSLEFARRALFVLRLAQTNVVERRGPKIDPPIVGAGRVRLLYYFGVKI